MAQIDPRIQAIRDQYGLDRNDIWELPQKKGTWVAKHAALEVVAAKAGIRFDMPQILEANGGEGVAAVCVQGVDNAGRAEWSIGEASPKNNKNAYPWAMAEKRAKDRVILKLVGLHGLLYSEEEADDFKASPAVRQQFEASTREPDGIDTSLDGDATAKKGKYKYGDMRVEDLRPLWTEMQQELDRATSLKELAETWNAPAFQDVLKNMPPGWKKLLVEHKDGCRDIFLKAMPDAANLGQHLDNLDAQGAGGEA